MRIAVVVFSLFCICGNCAHSGDTEDYFLAKGFEEWRGVKDFFRCRSSSEIDSLRFHHDPKVSIWAAWISCVEQLRTGVDQSKIARNTRKAEFLGFLSGTLSVPVPEWWKKHLFAMDLSVDLPVPLMALRRDAPGIRHTRGVSHHANTKLNQVSDTAIEAILDGQSVVLYWHREDTPLDKAIAFIAISHVARDKFVFAIMDQELSSIEVYCVDSQGRELWHSTAFTTHQVMIGGTGVREWNGVLEITCSPDRVAVFAATDYALQVDSFSIATGAVELRFTTLCEFPLREKKAGFNATRPSPQEEKIEPNAKDRDRSDSAEREKR